MSLPLERHLGTALVDQANIWQAVITGQQRLGAYVVSTVMHAIVQDVVKEFEQDVQQDVQQIHRHGRP